jgi:DNA-binding CsgD family transcriptional regulator
LRKVGESEQDRKIGMCLGAGMSVEKTAEFVGLSANTIRNHIDGNRAYIMGVKAEQEAVMAVSAAKKVEEIVRPAEERIKSFFDRSFRLSERALARAEAEGDNIDIKSLMAIHKDFTQWSAKFSASEAPKRLEVDGGVEHVHTIGGEVVDRLTAFMSRHENLLPPAIEAEIVG